MSPNLPNCPAPWGPGDRIQMAHGGGGRRSRELIERLLRPAFSNPALDLRHDSAVLDPGAGRIAFTTDSYVVQPLFFPGGDIGSLAVHGTVNDLAMAGAVPRWISVALVLEEGFALVDLERIVGSIREAAAAARVLVVTGDTKVVDRGQCDGLYLNTAGIGIVPARVDLHPGRVQPGDIVLLSGDVGRHGIAIMSQREGLAFEGAPESDSAPLADLVATMLAGGADVHCMRDPTRGGLATALIEIALDAGIGIELEADAIPVVEPVRGACELLGLDPWYVANEGRLVAFVAEADADAVLERMRAHPAGRQACRIGRTVRAAAAPGRVEVAGGLGSGRVLDLLSGEQLPRIC